MKPILLCCALGALLNVASIAQAQTATAPPLNPPRPQSMPAPEMRPPAPSSSGAAIAVDGNFLYIVRGDTLIKMDKNTLQIVGYVSLPPVVPTDGPQLMTPGSAQPSGVPGRATTAPPRVPGLVAGPGNAAAPARVLEPRP